MVPIRQQATRGVARMGKQLTGYKLWMYLEIEDRAMVSQPFDSVSSFSNFSVNRYYSN